MSRTPQDGEKPIVVYQDTKIFVDAATGKFWCNVDGDDWKAESLKALKTRLDDHARRRARAQVANLELAVAQRGSDRWSRYDGEGQVQWIVGTYLGLNAHTGDVRIKLSKGGEIQDISYGWFFLASDGEGRSAYEAAVRAEMNAKVAHERARKETERALVQHGHRVDMTHAYGKSKAEAAADAEEKFVAALTKEAK